MFYYVIIIALVVGDNFFVIVIYNPFIYITTGIIVMTYFKGFKVEVGVKQPFSTFLCSFKMLAP